MDKREEAKQLLKYYMRLIAKAAGVRWDSDNDGEVETIVDLMIDAAAQEWQAAADDRLEDRMPDEPQF